eukprot:2405174-Prymnesium_polylepis.1
MLALQCAMLLTAAAMPRGPTPAEKHAGRVLAGHAKARRWRQALGMLRSLPGKGMEPNTVHYNAVINACGRSGRWSDALRLLDELKGDGAPCPDEYSFTSTIAALASAPPEVGSAGAIRMLEQMRSLGLPPSTAAHNAAIRVLGTAGETSRALDVLARMRRTRSPPPDTI